MKNAKLRIDPCLVMTVGFILVTVSVVFAWGVFYSPEGREVLDGTTAIALGVQSIDYYYAPMTMMAAGLFALLPVFARKFLKDSEVLSSVLTLIVGAIAMVLMVLYAGSLSDVMHSNLTEGCSAALGPGVYIAVLGCVVIVVGAVLSVLFGLILKDRAAEPEPVAGYIPAEPVEECNEPIPTAVPVKEAPQEIDPHSLDTVDVIGGRAIHERPKRP